MTAYFIPQNVVDFAQTLIEIREQFVYDLNDTQTRLKLHAQLSHVCVKFLEHECYNYAVSCDETNNPPSIVDAKDLIADVVFVGEYFHFVFHLSNSGVNINGARTKL